MLHYSKKDPGEYYVEGGQLIGHEAVDVTGWLNAHPGYRGPIYFQRWDFEGSIEVTEIFLRGVDARKYRNRRAA